MEHTMIMKLVKEAYLEGLSIDGSSYEELCCDAPIHQEDEAIFEQSEAKARIEMLLRTKYTEIN